MKFCKKCTMEKDEAEFSPAPQCRDGLRPECKACHNAAEKARDTSHRVSASPEYKRRVWFRNRYGITPEEYDEMMAQQDGRCAICNESSSWNRREGHRLPIDHDHESGRIRALLCHPCNQALGLMRDDPERLRAAASYIERYRVEAKQDEANGS